MPVIAPTINGTTKKKNSLGFSKAANKFSSCRPMTDHIFRYTSQITPAITPYINKLFESMLYFFFRTMTSRFFIFILPLASTMMGVEAGIRWNLCLPTWMSSSRPPLLLSLLTSDSVLLESQL